MEILYSNIPPLAVSDGQTTITECFTEQAADCTQIDIAVGYASKAAIEELDTLAEKYGLHINLLLGMYFIEGMPEAMYHTARSINEKWKSAGIGEIRLAKVFKYHGKIYVFQKNGAVKSAIMGSANLGVIKLEANNLRQYEVSSLITDTKDCTEMLNLIHDLQTDRCSANIADIKGIKLIREVNTSLSGVDGVNQVPQGEVKMYKDSMTDIAFTLPIKVPAFSERHMDDGKHFTKSNLNVSYAAPRSQRKSRDWYETQFTVSKSITLLPGYPEKNEEFYVITDDGYTFKAHTTSDGNKQFSAVGDELILGRWIKGRLVSAGLVQPVNDTQLDKDRRGMITKGMLEAYGCNTLVLTKTDQKMKDDEGKILDVWVLSFEKSQAPVQEDDE